MKRSNKILVVIIILLLLLAIAGGAFAYAYIATDIFRSDKELFFKYFSQITEDEGFIDKRIEQFNEKKKQNPYENSGEMTVEVEYPDDSISEIIEKVNDLAINFSGSIDNVNQKAEQTIEVDYGNEVVFPITYRQYENNFGLQFGKLSKQYIALKNENLDELVKEIFSAIMGENIESMEELPIEINTLDDLSLNTFENLQFTDEEINQLKQIYGNILNNCLLDEYFSREKNGDFESYTLELTAEQIKNIVIKILEASKENTLLLDKFNEVIEELNETEETVKLDTTMIDSLIDSINEEDISKLPNFKLTLVENNKKLIKIIIPQEEFTLSIEKDCLDDSLSYKINFEIKTNTSDSNNSALDDESESSEVVEAKVYFNMQYNGLQNLSNVQENYELGFDVYNAEESMKYDYKIINNIAFKDSISVEELSKENAIFLNNLKGEQIINFVTNIGNKLLEINKKQMAELGLEEIENPLLYTNPIFALGLEIYESASNTIENTDLSEYERQRFNDKFLRYEGENVSGSEVRALISTVQSHNAMNEELDLTVNITIDGNQVQDASVVNTGVRYTVKAVYDENNLISEMRITTNN